MLSQRVERWRTKNDSHCNRESIILPMNVKPKQGFDMNQSDQIKFTAELIFKKFQAISINTAQTSTVIPRSELSLRRDRASKVGIPYTQFGEGKGKDLAMYSIYDIAEYMVKNKVKVA